jgi:AcrR family transcriptional regulator
VSTGDQVLPRGLQEPLPDGWARRRERIGRHIETVALQLFAEHGYRNVTVADVATAAGISARTAARYFPTKEDLLLAMPRRATLQALVELRAASREGLTVRSIWETWGELARDHQADVQLLGLWWQAAQQVPEAVARASGEQHRLVQAELTGAILTALGDDPDAALRATLLAAALHAANRAVVEYWLEHQDRDLAELFSSATTALAEQIGQLDGSATPQRRGAGRRLAPADLGVP